jgi:hypothetical protein
MAFQSFRINTPAVVHDTIDGEVIIIQLETGAYYSLGSNGVHIWERLAQGDTVRQILDAMVERCGADPSEVEEAVNRFLRELEREELIVSEPANVVAPLASFVSPAGANGAGLEGLSFQKYTDLDHLLLLDPVHDADESGWPSHEP